MGRGSTEQHSYSFFEKSLILCYFFFAMVLLLYGDRVMATELLIDRLLAEVGGKAITLSEVQSKVDKGPLIEVSPFPALESDPPNKIALQDLINKNLILQKSEELDIEVTEEVLDQEIKNFLEKRNLTREALNSALSQQGMTFEQYREDFRTQMVINQFEGRELVPQIKVGDRDIQLFYIRNSGALAENIRLTLRQLMVNIPQSAPESIKEAKRQLIDKAYQELEGGMPFEQVVKIYSDDEDAREVGGLMPQLFLKDLAPRFQEAVKDLDEGKFSKPINTGSSVLIFFVTKRDFAGSEDYTKQKPSLEAKLRQEELGRLLARWLELQRRRTDIKIKE